MRILLGGEWLPPTGRSLGCQLIAPGTPRLGRIVIRKAFPISKSLNLFIESSYKVCRGTSLGIKIIVQHERLFSKKQTTLSARDTLARIHFLLRDR